MIEWQNFLLAMPKVLEEEQENLPMELQGIIFANRIAHHHYTHFSPFDMM